MASEVFLCLAALLPLVADWRDIRQGRLIPALTYADQPYVVRTDDGAWLLCLTTGPGREGETGQRVITVRSRDQGRSWSSPVPVEPENSPENSYAVMLKVPSGRVYIFYNHNTDNVREIIADKPAYPDGVCRRVDSLGYFVFKYSDDHGRTWSARRYIIPLRDFEIDRRNPYGGKLKFFWNVGRPFVWKGAAYVPIHKVGGIGEGFFTSSEGALLTSPNLLTERDPEKIRWETLPEGDIGLRAPAGGGPIAEEQSFAVLSDGSFFCVYRTIDGYPACTYSRDGGRTWEPPQYLRYDDGRQVKHPRAANFIWRCENGKYLYWFHNHGGRWLAEHPQRRTIAYLDRNPAWLAAAVEADSPRGKILRFSQPEILLYDDDPLIRISYPDLIEEAGRFFVTETQKHIARVHEIDRELLEGLWNQFESRTISRRGLLLELPAADGTMPKQVLAPQLPDFVQRSSGPDYGTVHSRAGLSLELTVRFRSLSAGQTLLDNRTHEGRGFALLTAAGGRLEILLNDGRAENRWSSDPGMLSPGRLHHVAVIVDGGPRIILFVIDGKLCDGGQARQFGWGRFSPHLRSAAGDRLLRIGPDFQGELRAFRLYGRALRVSEAVAHARVALSPAKALTAKRGPQRH